VRRLFFIVILAIGSSSLPAHVLTAHHSVSGEFDPAGPLVLQGVITELKWGSPHVWVYLDVKDSGGRVVNWGVECAPPSRIAGAAREVLKVGDSVTINAYRARDTSRNDAHAYDVILADGRRFVIGLRLN
jgi:hypothetical protein